MSKISICGIFYDNFNFEEFSNRLGENATDEPVFIVTPNVDFIVRAHKNTEFKNILNNADYSLCDSAIVYFSSFFLKYRLKSKITGYDAMELLLSNAHQNNGKIFLFGSTDEILSKASQGIIGRYSKLKVAGKQNGFFNDSDASQIISNINKSTAEYLFIGMGSPKQELWVDKYKNELKVKYIICIGGLFDIYSGKTKRAPQFIQSIGMEWFWRFINEPRRLWRRYFIEDTYYFIIFFKQLFSKDRNNG